MSQSKRSQTVRRAVMIARLVGFCIYVWAFFLPACRQVATPGAGAPDIYQGYFCAWVTLVNSFSREMWHSKDFLAILSGWINPLILLYLVFLLFPSFRWPRRIVSGTIVAFLFGTWVLFALYPLVPMVGHFLWVAGILLILAGEATAWQKAGSIAD
ncbi:MAG: hypothetical protein ABSC48_07520 [Terracidiphilus sp.]